METPYRAPQQYNYISDTASNSRWEVSLEILRGKTVNRIRPVQSPAFLIGSADDCDLVLGDSQFSDVHACLLLKSNGIWLRHLGYRPETTVNGEKVGRVQLTDGDIIRTGAYEFQVRIRERVRDTPEIPEQLGLNGPAFLRIHPASLDAEILSKARHLLADIRIALGRAERQHEVVSQHIPFAKPFYHPGSAALPADWRPQEHRYRRA